MIYPTIVGKIAEAQKKNENKLIAKMTIFEAVAKGTAAHNVAIPNPITTNTDFLLSYPPALVETNPPKAPPKVGPKIEAEP